MPERQMTIEALGIGDGNVRIQITSADAGMSIDLGRQRAVSIAVGILRQAGVSSVSINPDGSYRAGTGEDAAAVAAGNGEEHDSPDV